MDYVKWIIVFAWFKFMKSSMHKNLLLITFISLVRANPRFSPCPCMLKFVDNSWSNNWDIILRTLSFTSVPPVRLKWRAYKEMFIKIIYNNLKFVFKTLCIGLSFLIIMPSVCIAPNSRTKFYSKVAKQFVLRILVRDLRYLSSSAGDGIRICELQTHAAQSYPARSLRYLDIKYDTCKKQMFNVL